MQFRLHLPASTLPLLIIVGIACCVNAYGQPEGSSYVLHPNQEVKVASLPSAVAASTSDSAVLAASLATALMEPEVCCGRNSALEDRIPSAKGLSLKELGEKLRGKHYLGDGLSFLVADQYWPGASVKAEEILSSLMAQHPLLMDWNGHLYVLYGAVFDEYASYSGSNYHVIHTLLLVDVRFSDRRRYVSFNRETDDWAKVSGLLALTVTRNK